MNRKSMWRLALALLAMGLLFAGCDDDPVNQADTNDTTEVEVDTTETSPDVTPDGTPDEDLVEPDVVPDEVPDLPDADVDPDVIPFAWPADPASYVYGSTVYVKELIIPPLDNDEVPTCCHDWGEISKDYIEEGLNNPDNALASLADLLGGFGAFDVQETLNFPIQEGTFALLWDHLEFTPLTDSAFYLVGFFGAFEAGTTYATASTGAGEFTVNTAAFKNGTGEPLIHFDNATMNAGAMTAGPSMFRLQMPLGSVILDVAATDARVTGTALSSADGLSYSAGTLAAYVLIEDVVEAVNAYIHSDTCSCLGMVGDLYTYNSDGSISNACMTVAAATALCPEESQSACVVLAGGMTGDFPLEVCKILPGFLTSVADIELDAAKDGYEALSVGLQWTAVPAKINGLLTEP